MREKTVGSYEDFENVVLKKLTLICTGKNDSNFLTDAGYVDSKALFRYALLTGTLIRTLYAYKNELIIGDRISSTLQQRLKTICEIKPTNGSGHTGTRRQIKEGTLTQH